MRARIKLNSLYKQSIFQKHMVRLPRLPDDIDPEERELGELVTTTNDILLKISAIKQIYPTIPPVEFTIFENEFNKILANVYVRSQSLPFNHCKAIPSLPREMWEIIFSHLNFEERANMRKTSKELKAFVDQYVIPEYFYMPKISNHDVVFYILGKTFQDILKELLELSNTKKQVIVDEICNAELCKDLLIRPNASCRMFATIYRHPLTYPLLIGAALLLASVSSLGLNSEIFDLGLEPVIKPIIFGYLYTTLCGVGFGASLGFGIFMPALLKQKEIKEYLDIFPAASAEPSDDQTGLRSTR